MPPEIAMEIESRAEAQHDPLDPPVIGPAWKCNIGLFLYQDGTFSLDNYIRWLIRTRQRAASQEVNHELCESR
jgi:hypothetical protein